MSEEIQKVKEPPFSKEARLVMYDMVKYVKENKLEFINSDILMLFVIQYPEGKKVFESFDFDIDDFKDELMKDIIENNPKIRSEEQPQQTVAFQHIINSAIFVARNRSANSEVQVKDLLLSILECMESDTFTYNYLQQTQLNLKELKKYYAHGLGKTNAQPEAEDSAPEDVKEFKALKKFGINLMEKAQKGLIDPVIGRNAEIQKVQNILGQRRKNNPILVGDAGVGKTAIAEGFAMNILNGNVPEAFKDYKVFTIEMSALLSGAKFRGEFEERLKAVIDEAKTDPNVVLFFDEIHTLVNSGGGQGAIDGGNILKSSLTSGEIKVIGATTFKEYREVFQKDSGLDRRFQKVDVNEPSAEDTLNIIKGLKEKFELHHRVRYSEGAIASAVDLSMKYINDKQLPDKAIDLIDMTGSKLKLNKHSQRDSEGYVLVTEDDIADVVAEVAGVPSGTIKSNEKTKLKQLEAKLNSTVFGQSEAISKFVEAIKVSRAGLSLNKQKPIGNFLFAGPTGTGKTELSKQLAEHLGVPLIRFDMSEFMEKHEVAKLVGAPPGYVGYSEGGKLTDKVKKTPHCVLLLDEIEKAHPDIFNILLQVMDHGKLTDGQNRTTDFKNVILVMTTNEGASFINKSKIGFTQEDTTSIDRGDAIKKKFAPEFINRLDSIVQFKELTADLIIKIVDKYLGSLMQDLVQKNVSVVVTHAAKEEIAKKGFNKELGARPLQRYIHDSLVKELADKILFGELEAGGDVIIDFRDNQYVFDITPYSNTNTRELKNKEVELNLNQDLVAIKKPRVRKKLET